MALLGDGRVHSDASDFVPEVTPAFGSISDLHTPPGFGTEVTETRRRDLGFVQPTEAERRTLPPPGPPELKMTLRTPGASLPPLPAPPTMPPAIAAAALGSPGGALPREIDRHRAPTAEGERDEPGPTGASTGDELSLHFEPTPVPPDAPPSYAELELDLTPEPGTGIPRVQTAPGLGGLGGTTGQLPVAGPGPANDAARDAEMLASLPAPRLSGSLTRPLPSKTRAPADSQPPASDSAASGLPRGIHGAEPAARPAVGVVPTQEMPLGLQLDPLHGAEMPHMGTPTHDFSERPTNAARGPIRPDEPLISAPTVELGLRKAASQPPETRSPRRPGSDEETTREVDVHRIRQARGTGKPEIPAMDPIDARSAEILEEIDRSAPANESREDRTRRRITALLERAADWGKANELERAVTAVDLALSEDPNSALSQKLIHRNREAIMNAFQGFLGDLQRTPALARPLHELGSAPISPRAAFLLSRVDGTLSLDEILDVSGMPRLEAYRYLCQLFLRGILR